MHICIYLCRYSVKVLREVSSCVLNKLFFINYNGILFGFNKLTQLSVHSTDDGSCVNLAGQTRIVMFHACA